MAEEKTLYALALELHAAGTAKDELKRRLEATGADAEAVRVALGALPDAPVPQQLPAPQLQVGINPLAPKAFSFSDVGLQGDAKVVGLYWLVFGAVLCALGGAAWLAQAAEMTPQAAKWGSSATVALLAVGALAVLAGALKLALRR